MPTHAVSAALPALADIIDVQGLQVSSQASLAAAIAHIGRVRDACTRAEDAEIAAGVKGVRGQGSLLNIDYYLLAFDETRPVGLLTSQDLVRCLALETDLAKTLVSAVMQPLPPAINADASLESAYQLMQQHQAQQLAIYDAQQRFLGLVTQGALLKALHSPLKATPWSEAGRGACPRDQAQSPTERLRIQARQQAAVAALGQQAIAAENLDAFLESAVEMAARMLNVEYGEILEILPGRDALLLRAGIGWRPGLVGQVILGTDSNSQIGFTLLNSEPVVVEDLATETRFNGPELLTSHGVISGVSVIIPHRARPFGVLGVHTSFRRRFSSDDIHFLQAIAHILSLVIERQTIERANQFQAHLLAHVTDAVIAIDNDYRVTYWNRAAEQLYGLNAQDVYGSRVTDCFDYRWTTPAEEEAAQTVLKTHGRWRGEQIHRLLSGEERWVEASISTLKDERGNLTGLLATIRDISDRKRAEAALRQSEATLAKAQEIAHIGSWEFDVATQTQTWSAQMFRLFGLGPNGPVPNLSQMLQFFPSQDWARAQQAVQQLLATTKPQRFEGSLVRPGGELRQLEGNSEALTNDQGEVIKLIGTVMDVTERKQRQDQLQLLEAVILHANDAILITEAEPIDPPGPRIIYANPAFTAMTGYSNEEVIGKTPRILQGPKTDRATLDLIRTALKTHERIFVELINYRKDGSEFWVEMGLAPIANSAGRVTHFVALQRDVSDRKQNEQKLQEQAALIDIATDAFLVNDLDNCVLFWSRGAERIYGWTAEEVLGQNADSLLNPEPSTQMQAAWQAVLTRGEWQGEMSKYTRTREVRAIESRWTLMRDSAGNPKAVLSVDTDITERKQLEGRFLRAQRLESLGALASGIAHDLNNILTPILGIAQILPRQLPDTDSSTADLLTILASSAKRGAALSKQILAFAHGADSELTALNMRYLILEVGRFVNKTFPKSISIRVSVPKDLWMLMGNATHLYQVLMNLCVNARDAMPNGGELSLSAQNIWLDQANIQVLVKDQFDAHFDSDFDFEPGPYVAIEVADTGAGIAPEIVDRIFEPFFTTKAPGAGTGLGLSTVANIVKRHHGQVQVHSQANQGSRFTIYLPAAPVEALPPVAVDRLPTGCGELILVVDDEPQIRQVTKALLENHHYRVLTARDGAEAIALCKAHAEDIDGLLIDMRMPKMSGEIALEALQRINPQLKVVFTSGVMSSKELALKERLKVHAFLPKPYSVEDLLNAMHIALKS